ncbi:MAG: hypothetical protein GXO43_00360 [Crenarchaeota archaeon]|nr:hypothetical protein [Thermoproteota archaeon]
MISGNNSNNNNNENNEDIRSEKEVIILSLFIYLAFIVSIAMSAYMFWQTYFSYPNLLIKFSTYFVLIIFIYIAITEIYDLSNTLSRIKLFSESIYINVGYILIALSILLSVDLLTDLLTSISSSYEYIFMIMDILFILGETILLYVLGRKIVSELDLKKLITRLYGDIYGLISSFWEKIKRLDFFADTTYLIFMMLLNTYLVIGFQAVRIFSVATDHVTIDSILNCLVLIVMIKIIMYSLTISYMMYTGVILSPEQKMDLRNILLTFNRRQPFITAMYYRTSKELENYIKHVFKNPLNDVIVIVPHDLKSECVRFIKTIKNNNTAVIIYLRSQMVALQKLPISSNRKMFYISSPQFMQISHIIRDVRLSAPTLRLIFCLAGRGSLVEKSDTVIIYRFIRSVLDCFCTGRFSRVFIEFLVPYNVPREISELLSLIVHDRYTLSKR